MTTTTIAFGTDDRYLHPLLVALTSLATNGDLGTTDCQVSVLHQGLRPETETAIRSTARALDLDLELFPIHDDLQRFPITDWISPAAYLRLRLHDAARGAERVLYLDCDLIAVRSLASLIDRPLEATLAAVRDHSNPVLGHGEGLPGYEALGLAPEREYFNSGVLLIDVGRWVDEQISERSVRFLVEHRDHVRYWDQCALNFVLDDRWERLPFDCNALPLSTYMPALADSYEFEDLLPLADALEIERHARVLHFAGPFKPWSPGYPECEPLRKYRQQEEILASLLERGPAVSR